MQLQMRQIHDLIIFMLCVGVLYFNLEVFLVLILDAAGCFVLWRLHICLIEKPQDINEGSSPDDDFYEKKLAVLYVFSDILDSYWDIDL